MLKKKAFCIVVYDVEGQDVTIDGLYSHDYPKHPYIAHTFSKYIYACENILTQPASWTEMERNYHIMDLPILQMKVARFFWSIFRLLPSGKSVKKQWIGCEISHLQFERYMFQTIKWLEKAECPQLKC